MGDGKKLVRDLSDLGALLAAARSGRRRQRPSVQRGGTKQPTAPPREQPTPDHRPERFADLLNHVTQSAPLTAEDRDLFRAAVADVRPLPVAVRADTGRRKPAPQALKRQADEAAALRQSQLAVEPSPMSWDLGIDIEEEQSYLRAGVNPDLLRKLRRGYWKIEAEIDLHFHTQDQAYAALQDFLRKARAEGWHCVKVIHGKGLSSFQRQPVLRGKVRRWLTRYADVAAFCEPRPNGGGSGAVLVLLNVG